MRTVNNVLYSTVHVSYELPFPRNEGHGFARFQRLVLKNFLGSWYRYISTEDLLPTKEAWPERINFRLQDGTEVELAS
jgi:hypothetical protein